MSSSICFRTANFPLGALVGTDELSAPANVTLHRSEELVFRRFVKIVQRAVERIEFVKIAVPPDRRAGAIIFRLLLVVSPLESSCRKVLAADPFRESANIWWNVVKQPMDPRHLWRIGIVHDQNEAGRLLWRL